ncbi:STAS domain-containing protein [Amycolatopsis sp., V23-08]|uniref:STAS domain-containing protein n=1 Tax=Amycolatopsis heterodermiae TaxID=3110235 RepID=A0ABU5RPQ2_9PSEU|nr:STAS domain-containing protein [Amycolatopsis sp., V23-08]MEA5367840.1 STAS domain-containing protein [Amycolatopsis sp., V23-08]
MSRSSHPERLEVLRVHGDSEGVVFSLYGELDADTAPKLGQVLGSVLAAKYPPEVLIVDLSGLSLLSVAGIRAVHAVHAGAGDSRVRVVTGDRPAVRELLHASHFDAVLDCYRSRMQAVVVGSRDDFVRHARAIWEASP